MSLKTIKKFTVYFFRGHYIDKLDDTTPIIDYELWDKIFKAVDTKLVDINSHQSRYIEINNNFYFMLFYNQNTKNLQNNVFKDKDGFIYGIILNRREANWPSIDNGYGELRKINAKQNEGIAEQAYFILDTQKSILLFASNQRSATSSILAKYLSIIVNTLEETKIFVNFRFIVHPESEERLEKMTSIKRIDIQLSGGDFLDSITNTENEHISTIDNAIISSIKAAKSFGGKTLSLSIGTNNTKEVNPIKKFIKRLQKLILSFPDEQETRPSRSQNKCSLTGVIDEETQILNLLEDRLLIQANIEIIEKYEDLQNIFDKLNECYKNQNILLLKVINNERREYE